MDIVRQSTMYPRSKKSDYGLYHSRFCLCREFKYLRQGASHCLAYLYVCSDLDPVQHLILVHPRERHTVGTGQAHHVGYRVYISLIHEPSQIASYTIHRVPSYQSLLIEAPKEPCGPGSCGVIFLIIIASRAILENFDFCCCC